MTSQDEDETVDLDFETRARANLERFCTQLGEYVPDPTNRRLLDPEEDYTPDQLRWMLQQYGSYTGNLAVLTAKLNSEHLILKRSAKLTKQIILGRNRSGHGTLAVQEAEILASEEGAPILEYEERMIMSESCIIIAKGWLEAYEQAYASASRVLAVMEMEANAIGGNQRFT